jgi:TatD DNase family protein
LTPVPYRGKRNEPAYVQFVAATIASVKSLTIEEVARATTNNVRALFRI